MANPTPTGAPRVPPGRDSLALTHAEAQERVNRRGGRQLSGTYPVRPMSAIPTVLLEAFHREREIDTDDLPARLDEVAVQQIYATYEGAQSRALVCGGLRGHDQQAAALLVAIERLDTLLDGGLTVGGSFERRLDRDELEPIWTARDTMVQLLDWHMTNGAGALTPIAKWQGLIWSSEARS